MTDTQEVRVGALCLTRAAQGASALVDTQSPLVLEKRPFHSVNPEIHDVKAYTRHAGAEYVP